MGDIRRRVLVRGRVQGVGFRYWTRGEAERLGLHGWVKNLPDGNVEAEIEGDPTAVAELLDALGHGPRGASVDGIDVSDRSPDGGSGFRILSGDRGGFRGWFGRG